MIRPTSRPAVLFIGFLSTLLGGCDNPTGSEPIAQVGITLSRSTLLVGDTVHLGALAWTADHEEVDGLVRWFSSDETVVRIGEDGVAEGIGRGEATATLWINGLTSEQTIRVVEVATIELPEIGPLIAGDSYSIQHVVRDADGQAISGLAATWTTSDPAVAVVEPSPHGGEQALLRALAAGEVELIVSVSGHTATRRYRVWPAEAVRIAEGGVLGSPASVAIGGSRPLRTYFVRNSSPFEDSRMVSWSSSDPSVVDVSDEGVITGVEAGAATIIALAEGARPDSLTVVARPGMDGVELPFAARVVNELGQVAGTRWHTDGTWRPVLWADGADVWEGPASLGSVREIVLNDAGMLAGTASSYPGPARGFVWDGATLRTIEPPDSGADLHVTGIARDGTVAGYWLLPGQPTRGDAFTWRDGELTNLGRFGGDHARVTAIGPDGDLLVTVWPRYVTFILSGGVRTDIAPGEGIQLNEGGDLIIRQNANNIVRLDGEFIEFVAWRHAGWYLHDLNEAGDVVGSLRSGPSATAVWRRGDVYIDPHDVTIGGPQYGFSLITDVNEAGQMIAHQFSGGIGGGSGTWLLTPRASRRGNQQWPVR